MAKQEKNRPELALLRGKETNEAIGTWVEQFAGGDSELAERYATVLSLFRTGGANDESFTYLGQLSPATREAYQFALIEFFEFIARKHRRVVAPHNVTRADAEAYVEWLANKPFTLEEEKLKDGDQSDRLAIYEAVKLSGGAIDAISIADKLPRSMRSSHPPRPGEEKYPVSMGWLNKELGRMVLHDLLVRSPTMEQLRQENPRAGLDEFVILGADGETHAIWTLFQYMLPRPTPVSRETIAQRLAALSAFWDALGVGDGAHKPVLQWNPWKLIKKRVGHGLAAERRASAAEHRMDPASVAKMLIAADGPSLVEKRDLALVRFLALTGARVSEAVQLRRGKPSGPDEHRWKGWLDTTREPAVVEVTRKGGKHQRLPFPPYAMEALVEFHAALRRHLPSPGAQSDDPNDANFLHRDSPKWRYKLLLEEANAPLFPPVYFWGANSTRSYQAHKPNIRFSFGGTNYTKGLTRHGVRAILRRIAQKAGLAPDELAKVHPHALRHFAATAMAQEGKNLREIQAILGHASITTTERYLAEEESLVALSGQNEILTYLARVRAEAGLQPVGPPAEPVPAAPRAVPTPKRPVETYGREVPGPTERPARTGEKSEPHDLPAAAEYVPENGLPESPAYAPDEPPVIIGETPAGKLVAVTSEPKHAEIQEIREGVSPGAPTAVYDALHVSDAERAAGVQEHPELIRWKGSGRDAARWLGSHYDPWPNNYGIGESSLLVWFATGNPKADGSVRVTFKAWDPKQKRERSETVTVAPVPVLAPAQVYSETVVPGGDLLSKVEGLAHDFLHGNPERGITPSPTRYAGLERWWGLLASATAHLEVSTAIGKPPEPKYKWVPFEAPAKIGEELRAQADWYVLDWLKNNAHTYGTVMRVFQQEIGAARMDAPEFAARIDLTAYEALSLANPIPEWFADRDPVHAIFERDPAEYAAFEAWIADLTGQRLSPVRREERDAQKDYAEEDIDARAARARELLETYYEVLAAYEDANLGERQPGMRTRDPTTRDFEMAKLQKTALGHVVVKLTELGVPDPATLKVGKPEEEDVAADEEEIPRMRAARSKAIVQMVFGDKKPKMADANVLQSELFDPRYLEIETKAKTIMHKPGFRKEFAARFGRDSECVMRRAARAMWEHYSQHGPFQTDPKKRQSQYKNLYAVMLAYIAWIYPCTDEIEERLGTLLRRDVTDVDLHRHWSQMNRLIRDSVFRAEGIEQPVIESEEQPIDKASEARARDIALTMLETLVERRAIVGELAGLELHRGEEGMFRVVSRGLETSEQKKERGVKKQEREERVAGERAARAAMGIEPVRRPKKPEPAPELVVAPTPPAESSPEPVPEKISGRRRVFVHEAGEAPKTWHMVGEELPGKLRPNASPVFFFSPNARQQIRGFVANAREVLPSPFRMMSAMAMVSVKPTKRRT